MIRTLDNVVNPVQIGQQALLPTSADTDDDDDDDDIINKNGAKYFKINVFTLVHC